MEIHCPECGTDYNAPCPNCEKEEEKPVIELDEFRPKIQFPKKVVESLGGHKVVEGLIENILDRYCNTEYFDPELAHSIRQDLAAEGE